MTSRPIPLATPTIWPSTRQRRFLVGLAAVGLIGQYPAWGATAKPITAKSITTKPAAATAAVVVAPTGPSICTLPGINTTTVAAIKASAKEIKVYTKPDVTAPAKTLKNWIDVKGRVVFNVLNPQGEFLDVKVPAKPNGAHGFVKADEVSTFQHSCRIVIELGARKLRAYKGDELLMDETVAVGAPQWPTPMGNFYTTALIRPIKRVKGKKIADPVYGPFAYTLSGFSETPGLENFGGGTGTLGIHGTNTPQQLGQAVSHGCIRISNDAITKLAKLLPIGVPVEIKA